MLAVLDEEILKLHVADDGEVWFADGTFEPRSSGVSARQFVDHGVFRRTPRGVRVLGLPSNAHLICQLYHMQTRRIISKVELAGPLVCETEEERHDPTTSLFRMRQCLLHSSLGGWHPMTSVDFATYRMIDWRQEIGGHVDAELRAFMEAHVLWKYLSFICGISIDACVKLVTLVVDPRWFVSPAKPERVARLEAFLGLDPKIQKIVSTPHRPLAGSREHNCSLVLSAWKTGEPPTQAELAIPGNFLWRDWRASGGGVKGDLRASQRFIAYFRHTWMQSLVTQQAGGRTIEVFDPSQIFKHADELAGFAAHIRQRFDASSSPH